MRANSTELTRNPVIVQVMAALVCSLALVCLLLAPGGAHVGSDVGYYLPLAERIGSGSWPMIDVPVHYTPLGIVLLAAPVVIWEHPPYEAYSVIQYLALFAGAAFTFFTLRRSAVSAAAASWASAYYCFCGLYFEGSTMLEPYVALFGCIGLFVIRAPPLWLAGWARWLVAGFCGSLCVLCKQQGFFVLLGLALLTATEAGGRRWLRSGLFVGGGMIGLSLLFIGLAHARGGWSVALANLTWAGRQYSGNQLLTGALLVASLLVLKTSPFLLGVGYMGRPLAVWLPMLAAAALAGVPTLLKPYPHYLVLVLPFSAILGGWAVDAVLVSRRRWAWVLLVALFGLLALQLARLQRRLVGPEQNLAVLRGEGALLASVVDHRRVLQLSRPVLTYFARLEPAGVDFAGYMFGGYFTLAEVRSRLLPDAQVVLTDIDATSYLFNDGTLLFEEMSTAGFCRRAEPVAGVAVWDRCGWHSGE